LISGIFFRLEMLGSDGRIISRSLTALLPLLAVDVDAVKFH
jgi:hypothetical protein